MHQHTRASVCLRGHAALSGSVFGRKQTTAPPDFSDEDTCSAGWEHVISARGSVIQSTLAPEHLEWVALPSWHLIFHLHSNELILDGEGVSKI